MLFSQSSHCALVILMELTRHYEAKGVLLEDIAKEHRIPYEILKPVARRLCELGIAFCQQGESEDVHWLFIKSNPSEITVYDIVMIFDDEMFTGRFIESDTGKLLPKSKVSHMINLERQHMVNYMRKRLKKINMKHWSEVMLKHSYF